MTETRSTPPELDDGGGGLLPAAFDPQLFRENSETALGKLEKHLSDQSIRGLELTDPAVLTAAARSLMTAEQERIAAFDEERFSGILDLYLRTGIQVHSPGYMGRQFSGVVPLSGVVDFVSSVVNQPSSFYEAGQLPNVAERIMADELNRFIGWEPGRFAMVTTSGGSLANLTALLAARNTAFPGVWARGTAAAGRDRPAVAVGADVHYSVSRAAGVMGIGEDQIVRLPLDDAHCIDVGRAGPALTAAAGRGLRVFCLVASAGTTSVGAFDPLDELADLAHARGIWLHVDGAHGASLLVSDRQRHLLRGIDKADSLTWDAHKMMFVPAPCTLLFYRDKAHSRGAFRQQASYVFDEEPDIYTALDSGDKNFECTKRPMIMTLWTLWAMYGPALFAEKIDYLCALTARAHDILEAEPDFETIHRPDANILCFRYRPAGLPESEVHRFQVAVRNRVKFQGNYFISKVDVHGVAALRVVMMNHQITPAHIRMLLAEIRKAGQELLDGAETREPQKGTIL
ncbi:pyridoxal phosphate-dependent decarboxylase family protein [Yinghuangia seranimata]|uniref:pyridoxal phosphate-dependent decarboxylase family protein n=1 Tax=Yinghuangia seranimata TaxID=408067 RepID=UPI00248CC649|nr:pyridoxal-dependent decarboxylase [Yinghuangia seranimata]MDI2126453.1 pyridoxal-dependent decarboxylase [Yinghuangia seranimata]